MERATEILRKNGELFHPVVPFDSAKDRLLVLDFSPANIEFSGEQAADTPAFIKYINEKLHEAGAKFGIGGYDEYRQFYSRSDVFGNDMEEEPRRLHLGIDIWGKPYTAVSAPMDGIVHSFAFNDRQGDYGATLILTHNFGNDVLHSLYGHLSLNSIKNFREGARISKGDVIGEFGIPMENGQWPPHLHFQLIIEMGTWKGDYPGVCKNSEKGSYLQNSPNPDLVLRMMDKALKK